MYHYQSISQAHDGNLSPLSLQIYSLSLNCLGLAFVGWFTGVTAPVNRNKASLPHCRSVSTFTRIVLISHKLPHLHTLTPSHDKADWSISLLCPELWFDIIIISMDTKVPSPY